MPFTHSLSAIIKIDNNAGSLTDYTDYIGGFSFPRTAATAEVSTLGDAFQQFVSGLKGGTFNMSGPYDPVIAAILNTSYANGSGTTKTLEVSPQGTGSGNDKVTCEVFCTNIVLNGDTGSAMNYSADFQVTGTITAGTH
jgi:hypothetical protein